jgi:pilus assembly protein CpaF
MEGDIITLQELFVFDHSRRRDENGRIVGILRPTGLRPNFIDKLAASGVTVDMSVFGGYVR